MKKIIISENEAKSYTWFTGKFIIDCSFINSGEFKENIITVSYFINNDGNYYTISKENDKEYECIELPLKTSNNYPFSTGLIPNENDFVTFSWARHNAFLYFNKYSNIKLDDKINDIFIARNDNYLIDERKAKHDNWYPSCFINKYWQEELFDKSSYSKNNGIPLSYLKYENNWFLAPFIIPDINNKNNYNVSMIPICFAKDKDKPFTFQEKWLTITLPSIGNAKSFLDYNNAKNILFPNNIGLLLDFNKTKPISANIAYEWFTYHNGKNMLDLKQKIAFISNIRQISIDEKSYFDYLKIKNEIDKLIVNKAKTTDILNLVRSKFGLSKNTRKLIQKYLIEVLNNKLLEENTDLTKNEIQDICIVPSFSIIDSYHPMQIISYGEKMFFREIKDSFERTTSLLKGYQAVHTLYKDYTNKSECLYNGNYERAEEILNYLLILLLKKEKLDITHLHYIDNYFITTNGLKIYIDKSIIDIAEAITNKNELTINYCITMVLDYEEPLEIKFGKITIDKSLNLDISNIEEIYDATTIESINLDNIKVTTYFDYNGKSINTETSLNNKRLLK